MTMEDNKYYTPEISEFHVGFEYEWYFPKDKTWDKAMQEYPDPGLFDNGDGEHPFEYQLSDIGIRVKYIDKKDIEELGWEYVPSIDDNDDGREGRNGNICDYRIYNKNTDYKLSTQYKLSHRKSDNVFFIDEYNEFGNLELRTMIGYITIKNKSELKKLMQMLNITN